MQKQTCLSSKYWLVYIDIYSHTLKTFQVQRLYFSCHFWKKKENRANVEYIRIWDITVILKKIFFYSLKKKLKFSSSFAEEVMFSNSMIYPKSPFL